MSLKDKIAAERGIGFRTAPLGNMFRNIPEEEAAATVDAAWSRASVISTRRRSTALACPRSVSARRWPGVRAMNTC